jgi:uroporphyrinogen decarboxylase
VTSAGNLDVDTQRAHAASGLFRQVLGGRPAAVPPIWLMRQAGRYHRPYQALRARHSFETLCREPDLAAEVAMGPMRDFDFDAAILFSDLLFPLEALGFGLSYDNGPPKLDGTLSPDRVARFRPQDEALARLTFQRDAMAATRALLPTEKALLGFVGGPWTLFVYAMEGTHAGPLVRSKSALDLYRQFADRMGPLLVENIRLQFDGGADAVMIFDTAAGELAPDVFREVIAPDLGVMTSAFPKQLGYYAKGLSPQHLREAFTRALISGSGQHARTPAFVRDLAGLGFDKDWDLTEILEHRPYEGFVQGNFDPQLLRLTGQDLERALDRFLAPMRALDAGTRRGWICGLGHGVLPDTPEESVRTFVRTVRRTFEEQE